MVPSVEALMSAARSAEAEGSGASWRQSRSQRWSTSSGAAAAHAPLKRGAVWGRKGPRAIFSSRQDPVPIPMPQGWMDWSAEAAAQQAWWCSGVWDYPSYKPTVTPEPVAECASVASPSHTAIDFRALGKWKDQWDWDEYIAVKGSTIRVEMGGTDLGDSDLGLLCEHLEGVLQSFVEGTGGKYILSIDLSCNLYISDDGIADHLAPFLLRWPICHRLKLYKTSIGDGALDALGSWVAGGHAHELHLSDLAGQVTGEGVFRFLKEATSKGSYPYCGLDRPGGAACALWLRLENNAIPNTDKLMSRAQTAGLSVCVLQKADLVRVRPGQPLQNGKEACAVNLPLFHMQELRVSRKWVRSIEAMAPLSPELRSAVGSAFGGRHCFAASGSDPAGPAAGAPRGGQDSNSTLGSRAQARLDRALDVVMACPTGADDEVFDRWRRHLEKASDPVKEARRILRMTAKLCDGGYLEESAEKVPSSPSATESSDRASLPAGAACAAAKAADCAVADGGEDALAPTTASGAGSEKEEATPDATVASLSEKEDSGEDALSDDAGSPPIADPIDITLIAAPCA